MLHNEASNPGAIIIDGHGRADLGVVHALGKRGVPVHLFTDAKSSPVSASRFVTRVWPLPPAAAGEEGRVQALIEAGKRFLHRPVFFSTGDSSALLFSRHRESLEPYFCHHLSDPALIEDLYDKTRFVRLAREMNLPVPFSVAPANLTELELMLPSFTFPVVVKPAEKRHWAAQPEIVKRAEGNVKAVRIDTAEALLDFYRLVSPLDSAMVIQDYIEGRDEEIYELHTYIDHDGDVVGLFTGRKLRTYPIHRGVGCFTISVFEPEVVKVGLGTLKKLGYTGHAAVQLKRLPDQKRFQIFEINCRYSAWNELHTRAGVNLAYAAYRDCLGQKQRRLPHQQEGLRWVDLANDLRAFEDYRRAGEWGLREWAHSYSGLNSYALFDWSDPLPGLLPAGRQLLRLSGYPLRWAARKC